MDKAVYTSTRQREILRVFPELARDRQLLFDLIWKEVRVRYRYAAMGFFWAVLEPLFMMLVLTFVFSVVFQGRVAEHGIEGGRSYAVFVLSGLISWQFFSGSLSSATRSLVDNRNLITKARFAREVVPLSSIGLALVNLTIGAVLFVAIYWILLGHPPPTTTVYILPLFLVQLALVVGFGLVLAAANTAYRDVAYMVDAALLFGFYATPIFYPPSLVAETFPKFYTIYMANPMAGLVTAYRQILIDGRMPEPGLVVWPAAVACVALLGGVAVFRKTAPDVADRL